MHRKINILALICVSIAGAAFAQELPMATPDPKSEVHQAAETLSADLERQVAEIRADLAALTKTLGRYGKSRADDLSGQASDMTKEAVDEAMKVLRGLKQRLGAAEMDVERSLRDHPANWLGGVMGVLGLGILLGLLLRHRD